MGKRGRIASVKRRIKGRVEVRSNRIHNRDAANAETTSEAGVCVCEEFVDREPIQPGENPAKVREDEVAERSSGGMGQESGVGEIDVKLECRGKQRRADPERLFERTVLESAPEGAIPMEVLR